MQIVGYDSGVGGLTYDPVGGVTGAVRPAALLVAEDGDVRRVKLTPGTGLAYTLRGRHCAGTHDGAVHDPCDAAAAPHCDRHVSRWACARCRGECDLPLESCREEHAVYLAAFAPDAVKVGVTRIHRLHTRWREQGADRAAHLRTVSNGRLARRTEADIAADLPDRVSTARKIRGLHRDVDERAWRSLLEGYDVIDEVALEYGLDLDGQPVAETLATGTVLGTKGRVLALERRGSTYAVDLRDLVGHEVVRGETDRDLQSSLGAFG